MTLDILEGRTVRSFLCNRCFVEKNPDASGKELVSLGIYKLFKKDLDIPKKLPISMEYDILPEIDVSYKILKTRRFDIGTPDRLKTFQDYIC